MSSFNPFNPNSQSPGGFTPGGRARTGFGYVPASPSQPRAEAGAHGTPPADTAQPASTHPPVGGGPAVGSVVTEDGPSSQATARGVSAAPIDGPPGPSSDTPEPTEEDTLTADLDQLTRQRDEYLALAQRTKADFENFRKRKAREAEVAETRAVARFAKELLPALDNLQRAVGAAAEDDPLLEGVRFVHTDLVAAFGRMGIESFSPEGETFDPAEHEAVAQTPIEGAVSGTVVEVYQVGYRANGNVLRPARVVVAA